MASKDKYNQGESWTKEASEYFQKGGRDYPRSPIGAARVLSGLLGMDVNDVLTKMPKMRGYQGQVRIYSLGSKYWPKVFVCPIRDDDKVLQLQDLPWHYRVHLDGSGKIIDDTEERNRYRQGIRESIEDELELSGWSTDI